MFKTRALVLALSLGSLMAFSATALADDGPAAEASANANDPGIAALHDATDTFREARAALRADCTGRLDKTAHELCRTKAAEIRAAFKAAHETAKAQHHAFREAQKAAHAKGKPETAPRAPKKP